MAGVAGAALWPLGKLSFRQARISRKPNIVFILGDDLGYAELGCYGQQKIKTPNNRGQTYSLRIFPWRILRNE